MPISLIINFVHANQKDKHGKQHQDKKSQSTKRFPATEFIFSPITKTCACPEGKTMGFLQETKKKTENSKIVKVSNLLP